MTIVKNIQIISYFLFKDSNTRDGTTREMSTFKLILNSKTFNSQTSLMKILIILKIN